jgi:hypothetical protein
VNREPFTIRPEQSIDMRAVDRLAALNGGERRSLHWIFQRGMDLGRSRFYLHPIAVFQLVLFAQPQVGRDLDDVSRVMTDPLLIQIRTQQERRAIEDPAWNKADRYAAPILVGFEPDEVGRKRLF